MEYSQKFVKLHIGADTIACTDEHPFFENGVWVAAKDLRQGDSLFAYSGYKVAIDSIFAFRTDTATKVYNLEASWNHNYYVSASGVLVHNCETGIKAVLKNGYYEVNGFKFSKYYYEKLWATGRQAPSLRADAILKLGKKIGKDRMKGFYRYEYDGWEMIFNPKSKEVWHLQPIK